MTDRTLTLRAMRDLPFNVLYSSGSEVSNLARFVSGPTAMNTTELSFCAANILRNSLYPSGTLLLILLCGNRISINDCIYSLAEIITIFRINSIVCISQRNIISPIKATVSVNIFYSIRIGFTDCDS